MSSCGASGGLCTLWNAQQFRLEEWFNDSNWLLVTLVRFPISKSYSIINVYIPSVHRDKIFYWNSFLSLQGRVSSTPLIFVGEFNTTPHFLKERGIYC
jgi:hypothetical protein